MNGIAQIVSNIDWRTVDAELDEHGFAPLGPLLSEQQCTALTACYADEPRFRSRIVMSRYGFGQGEYRYFDYPLPDTVQTLREHVFSHAARTANRWRCRLDGETPYPDSLGAWLERCHQAGQRRPTPLLLKYGPGDYNCLHQDLYGELVFPLQLVVLLSDPQRFTGGELVLVEQRPRMQSRAEVVNMRRGEGVLMAVNERPRRGTRGYHRVRLRHGVSRLRSGERMTLGIIFHDAK